MSKEHCCKHLKVGGGHNSPVGFSIRWADHHGWSLYEGDQPLPEYRWLYRCEWCGSSLPLVDGIITDPIKEHRCQRMVHNEWGQKQAGNDVSYLVCWDGWEWVHLDYDNVTQRHLRQCPYCALELPNVKNYRNKVIIE
jgi:hypothetical protein